MNLIYFAHGLRGLKCLEALLEHRHRVVAVVGHSGAPSDVLQYADRLHIPTFQPEKVNSPEFIEQLRTFQPDLFILAGYNRILKADLIHVPARGCINLHGGKLPEYRGCAPINWQIINGETTGGCCVLFVDEGIDTGAIIDQAFYPITDTDTSADIVAKQLQLFPAMLLKALADLQNHTLAAVAQNPNLGCCYTRRYPRDGRIHWRSMTARGVYNLVRALADPYPNAFTYHHDQKVRIRKTQMLTPPVIGIPGRLPRKTDHGILICCADQALLVTEIAFDDQAPPCNPRDLFPIGADFQ